MISREDPEIIIHCRVKVLSLLSIPSQCRIQLYNPSFTLALVSFLSLTQSEKDEKNSQTFCSGNVCLRRTQLRQICTTSQCDQVLPTITLTIPLLCPNSKCEKESYLCPTYMLHTLLSNSTVTIQFSHGVFNLCCPCSLTTVSSRGIMRYPLHGSRLKVNRTVRQVSVKT